MKVSGAVRMEGECRAKGNLQLHYNDTVMGFGPLWQDCRSCVFSSFFFRADFEDCSAEPASWELHVLLGEVFSSASN